MLSPEVLSSPQVWVSPVLDVAPSLREAVSAVIRHFSRSGQHRESVPRVVGFLGYLSNQNYQKTVSNE